MLAAVLSLGTMTAFAQEEAQQVTTEATEVAAEATEAIEAAESEAVEATESAIDVVASQDSFNEVAVEELPEAITTALEAAHPGATISKAYMNEESQYKLEVANEDGSEVELYADENGNWIEM